MALLRAKIFLKYTSAGKKAPRRRRRRRRRF